jgi:hypothetical protein
MQRFYAAAALLLFACGTAVYLWRVTNDPPGFYIDESSICYNAHVLSQTGHDEYGVEWPLFFRAFGEYKNPTRDLSHRGSLQSGGAQHLDRANETGLLLARVRPDAGRNRLVRRSWLGTFGIESASNAERLGSVS